MGGTSPRYPKPFPVWTTYAGHGGVDYPYPAHTPIRAVADGRITFSGWWNNNAGNTRTLTTPEGIQIMHCHLVNLSGPPVGANVKAGDVIGYIGTTGRSTGNHLHQEIWINGVKQSGDAYWRIIDKNRVISHQPSPASGGSVPSSKPGNTPRPVPEEDDMIAARITDGAGVQHHAIIGNGYFRHLIGADDPEWQKNVVTADDRWTDIPIDRLPSVLRTYACDLHIWDIKGGTMVVRDPLDGSIKAGNLWSAVNAVRSTVGSVQVTSAETAKYVKQLATAK